MPQNPLGDTWDFLLANTGDYNSVGMFKYVLATFFICLLLGSVVIAGINWSRDPSQRTGKHVVIWLLRSALAGLWFQGSIWKLPLPASGAFTNWTEQLGKFSAIPSLYEPLVNHVLLPAINVLDPLVYLFEVLLTVSLLLGVGVRLMGILAALFTANLWLGLYNDPTEWAWTYWGIIGAHGMFAATEAGRSLGLDNLLRGEWAGALARRPGLRRAYMLAS